MNVNGKRKKNQVVTANIFEQQELLKKAEVIRANLTASTWRELETNGKFDKNEKGSLFFSPLKSADDKRIKRSLALFDYVLDDKYSCISSRY